MSDEVIEKYLGKYCKISTGAFGITIAGKIIDIEIPLSAGYFVTPLFSRESI
ncbi:MAG: hypothetical protein ABRQ25_18975 [Clostridiaceae bacterium]